MPKPLIQSQLNRKNSALIQLFNALHRVFLKLNKSSFYTVKIGLKWQCYVTPGTVRHTHLLNRLEMILGASRANLAIQIIQLACRYFVSV